MQDLLSEAGEAILDRTRTLSSSTVPDTIRAIAGKVGNSLPTQVGLGALTVGGSAAVDAVWTGVATAGRLGRDGVRLGWSWFGSQAEEIARYGDSLVSGVRGRSSTETEALLQDALRKHDALIRELQDRNAASSERLAYLHELLVRLEGAMSGLVADEQPSHPDHLVVLAAQRQRLDVELRMTEQAAGHADANIAKATALLAGLAARRDAGPTSTRSVCFGPPVLRPWDEILSEAKNDCDGEAVSFGRVLSEQEQRAVSSRLSGWDDEFAALHRLTSYDYAVAGVAGILGALADILLVKVPGHSQYLGSATSEGGWLSNVLNDGFDRLLPADTVQRLEQAYKVPYDASTNFMLDEAVVGLNPWTHRLHSLGHDPILGWFFGVRDILGGQLSTIGADGSYVVQRTIFGGGDPEWGIGVFARLAGAFCSVGGHMVSDMSTATGLPPPLFGALQTLQAEVVDGQSIASIARDMYLGGYDFRHFLAGGVCVAAIEAIVRTAWLAGEISDGKPIRQALPVGAKPRLRTTLFLAHGVASAVNAGKVAVTGNPLALNYAQWLAFFRYLLPQLHWVLLERERERGIFVRAQLEDRWTEIDHEVAETWRRIFGPTLRAEL